MQVIHMVHMYVRIMGVYYEEQKNHSFSNFCRLWSLLHSAQLAFSPDLYIRWLFVAWGNWVAVTGKYHERVIQKIETTVFLINRKHLYCSDTSRKRTYRSQYEKHAGNNHLFPSR